MKIDKDIESTNQRRVLRDRFQDIKEKAKDAATALKRSGDDSVQVPLGRAVQDTLASIENDPVRAARVAELKSMVQGGRIADYFKKVSSDTVAPRVSEEIDLEILTSKSRIDNEEEE